MKSITERVVKLIIILLVALTFGDLSVVLQAEQQSVAEAACQTAFPDQSVKWKFGHGEHRLTNKITMVQSTNKVVINSGT